MILGGSAFESRIVWNVTQERFFECANGVFCVAVRTFHDVPRESCQPPPVALGSPL